MSVYHYERGHGHIERVPQDESTSKRKVAYVAFDDDQETKNINETGSKKYPITQELDIRVCVARYVCEAF